MSYASKEQLKQILQKIDDNFARKDGYYTNMAVGNAENLISPDGLLDTPENDTEYNPFSFRTTAGDKSISDGVATANKIRGRSYKWNQLVQNGNFESTSGWNKAPTAASMSVSNNVFTFTTASSVNNRFYRSMNVPANHKVLFSFDFMGDGQPLSMRYGQTTDTSVAPSGDSVLISGATIASYTYWTKITTIFKRAVDCSYLTVGSLSSAQAGIVWKFRNFMCIDLTNIYGAGNEPTTVDQFLADYPMFNSYVPYTEGSITGVKATNIQTVGFNAFNPTTGKAFLLGGKEYQITGAYASLSYSTGETITPDANGKFTPAKNGELTVTGGNSTTTCVHLTWSGYRNGEYEPYWKQRIATRISDYFADGMHGVGSVYDELTSTRAIKRFEIVNMGTLNYVASGTAPMNLYCSNPIFFTGQKLFSVLFTLAGTLDGILASDYTYYTESGVLRIRCDGYTDATSFRDAMAGVYLIYELATPVETPIDPPINFNYRVSDFGTEEFIYGDGDVQVPVPCELFYQNNLVGKLRNINDLTASELEEVINGLD